MKELRLELAKVFDPSDRTSRMLLSLLVSYEVLMSLLGSILKWSTQFNESEGKQRDLCSARYHPLLLMGMSVIHETLKPFDDLDGRGWFETHLPGDPHRAETIAALDRLRSLVTAGSPFQEIRNHTFHLDGQRLAGMYREFGSLQHEPALLCLVGESQGDTFSPLAAELLINLVTLPGLRSYGDHFHSYEKHIAVQADLLTVMRNCLGVYFMKRGARLVDVEEL